MKRYFSGFSEHSAFVKHIDGRNTSITNFEEFIEPLTDLEVSFLNHIHSHNVNVVLLNKEETYWKLCSLEQRSINFYYDNVYISSMDSVITMYRKSKSQAGSSCWFNYRKVSMVAPILIHFC